MIAGNDASDVIHYIGGERLVDDGLVLVDAGCEWWGYASDITRTWPISGTFTAHEKELYEAVLSAHQSLIQKAKEGASLNGLYNEMGKALLTELDHLGLFAKPAPSDSEKARLVHDLCPHHVGHYLGMDVHDTPLLPRALSLKDGMAITLEPGVYVQRGSDRIRKEFWGMGVRVEDDLLIGEEPEVMTESCPKRVEEIERACAVDPCEHELEYCVRDRRG